MHPPPFEAVVAACVGIDTHVYLYGEDIDFRVEANVTRDIDCVGQADGYSSRAFSALGLRTALVASAGRDAMGDLVRRELAQAGCTPGSSSRDFGGPPVNGAACLRRRSARTRASARCSAEALRARFRFPRRPVRQAA